MPQDTSKHSLAFFIRSCSTTDSAWLLTIQSRGLTLRFFRNHWAVFDSEGGQRPHVENSLQCLVFWNFTFFFQVQDQGWRFEKGQTDKSEFHFIAWLWLKCSLPLWGLTEVAPTDYQSHDPLYHHSTLPRLNCSAFGSLSLFSEKQHIHLFLHLVQLYTKRKWGWIHPLHLTLDPIWSLIIK